MAMSSFSAPSLVSAGDVFVFDVSARSMSSAVISSSTPPAVRNAARLTPNTWNTQWPNKAKNASTAPPTRHARAAMLRAFSGLSRAVIARNSGTVPMGSTTKKTAGSATSRKLIP